MADQEEHLVRSACGGDRAAFEELVRRTSRTVFARLYLQTGSRERAEDLLQETMLEAFRAIGSLAEPRRFRSWLATIAENVAIDAARRDLRRKRAGPTRSQSGELLDELPGPGSRPDEAAAQRELRAQVLACLRSLPQEYREPLTLRYIAGADYDTICRELGLTNGSLRGLLHRGLKLLRGKLAEADMQAPGPKETLP